MQVTFADDLTTPTEIREAIRVLAEHVVDDVIEDGRPVVRITLKIRYVPFFTVTRVRKLPEATAERDEIVAAAVALADRVEPDRAVRLLGVRAEMSLPEDRDPDAPPTRHDDRE